LNCSSVTANFTTTEVGLSVTCSASANTSISEYAWDFGDGAIGSGPVASHSYTNDGTYVIKLVVENLCGQKDSITKTITVCAPLNGASIGVSPVGLSVGYTSAVTAGTPVQFYWNFGDNTSGSGANPNHVYALDGTYNVTLIVVNLCGDSTTTTTPVQVCSAVLPQFTLQQIGSSITVDAWGTPGAAGLTFNWDFGDGNTGSGPIANNTYGSPGTYVVTLVVLNSCGESYTTTQTVKVCQPPVVDFTFKIISTGGNGMLVEFDASASLGAGGYLWNFGDGNTSTTGPVVQHLYLTPGLFYVVQLTLTDTCGTTRSDAKSLSSLGVSDPDQVGLILYPNPVQGTDAILAGWKGRVDTFQAMNALGQVMGQVTTRNADEGLVIECAQWPAGIYMIHITGPDQVFTGQLVIGSR
jgi:PKD repeat protein